MKNLKSIWLVHFFHLIRSCKTMCILRSAYWPQSTTIFYSDLHDIFEPISNPNWTYICFDNPQLQKLQRIETKHNITEPVSECINDGNDQSRHSRPEKLKMSSYQKTREMNINITKKSYFEYFPWKWFTTKKGNILKKTCEIDSFSVHKFCGLDLFLIYFLALCSTRKW